MFSKILLGFKKLIISTNYWGQGKVSFPLYAFSPEYGLSLLLFSSFYIFQLNSVIFFTATSNNLPFPL